MPTRYGNHSAYYFPFMGSVSSGTLREEDLIPRFVDLLSDVLEWAAMQPGSDHPETVRLIGEMQSRVGEIERRIECEDYFGDDAIWDLEWLIDSLSDLAPELCYFGSTEGDGAAFGYWPSSWSIDDYRQDRPDCTGEDLPEPEDYEGPGSFLQVNERGNTAFYTLHENEWHEVWSIV